MAGFGLLLILVGFGLMWLAYRGVDWGQGSVSGSSILEGVFDAVGNL